MLFVFVSSSECFAILPYQEKKSGKLEKTEKVKFVKVLVGPSLCLNPDKTCVVLGRVIDHVLDEILVSCYINDDVAQLICQDGCAILEHVVLVLTSGVPSHVVFEEVLDLKVELDLVLDVEGLHLRVELHGQVHWFDHE